VPPKMFYGAPELMLRRFAFSGPND